MYKYKLHFWVKNIIYSIIVTSLDLDIYKIFCTKINALFSSPTLIRHNKKDTYIDAQKNTQ